MSRRRRKAGPLGLILATLAVLALLFSGRGDVSPSVQSLPVSAAPAPSSAPLDVNDLPEYQGSPWVEVNGGAPSFDPQELTAQSFEQYSELDDLGRCGAAYACLSREGMPTGEREATGQHRPTGWHTVRYDELIEGKYLYNRCHLMGWQLTGQTGEVRNLITGTRYLNTRGMLPWENKVADYLKESGNHVLYRVTPVFQGEELLARGVLMEAQSVEDDGEGLRFCVYAFNVQPGISIDYATGDSAIAS